MAFLENLSGMISERGKEAAGAAKKVAEIANLKGKIGGLEAEIKKNYRKIGEAYYEAYKYAEVTCEFEEYVQAIRDANKSVEELTYKINELKGEVVCKGCGNQVKTENAFCPKCGTKIEIEYFDDEDEFEEETSQDVVEVVVEAEEDLLDEGEEV